MHFDIVEIWREMGIIGRLVTVTLSVMSVWSIGVMIERAFTFFIQKGRGRRFAAELAELLTKGKVREAYNRAAETKSYLSNLVEAGLKEWFKDGPRTDAERVEHTRNALDRSALRENQKLKRGQGVLGTVGSTAPFVGLLGTTMGIVGAFERMAETGGGGLGTISAAIGEALLNTAFGLIVAIPAVIAFNFVVGRTEMFSVDMTEASSELVDFLGRQPAPKAGAPEKKAAPAAEPKSRPAAAQG